VWGVVWDRGGVEWRWRGVYAVGAEGSVGVRWGGVTSIGGLSIGVDERGVKGGCVVEGRDVEDTRSCDLVLLNC